MNIHMQSLLNNKNWVKCRLETYHKQIITQDFLLKQNIKNLLEIPKIKKITLHFTSSAIVNDKKFLLTALVALEMISGQQPVIILAKKSVAAFKVRKKQLIGCKTTLRGNKLFFFLDNLINVVLPRLSDSEITRMSAINISVTPAYLKSQRNKHQSGLNVVSRVMNPTSGIARDAFASDASINQHCFGVKQLLLFPQLENQFQIFESLNGLDIVITTSCSSRENKKTLPIILSSFQLPFSPPLAI